LKSVRKVSVQLLRYVVAVAALLLFTFPIFWVAATAFKSAGESVHIPPVWLPSSPTLLHFENMISFGGLVPLLNSALVATLSTVLSLLIGSLTAYGLARYKVGGDNLPFFILSQRFMPPVAMIFPFLIVFKTLKWVDTYHALVIVYLTFNLPYAVWMMRGFFKEIPVEIEESGLVDGCSPFGAFWRIALPLVRSGLVATGTFCFIFSWTEFFFALALTRRIAVTLPVYMISFFTRNSMQWGQVGATSVLAMIPLFLVSIITQRYLVRGLTLGAVK